MGYYSKFMRPQQIPLFASAKIYIYREQDNCFKNTIVFSKKDLELA